KEVNLAGAKIDGVVNLSRTKFEAPLNAENLRSQRELKLQKGIFKNDVSLSAARIDGNVNLSEDHFEAPLNAVTLEIGGSLVMGSSRFKAVNLMAAKIAGHVLMAGSSFAEPFIGSLARIGGYLAMASDPQHTTTFKQVNLSGAKITEQAFLNYTVF